MKKFVKKSIENWLDILFITLLMIIFVFSIIVVVIQDDVYFRCFLICIPISCIALSIVTAASILKTFKLDNRLSNGKWKVYTPTFWIDIICMLSIVASYLLIAFGILLINMTLVNICVICLGIYVSGIVIRIILFIMQNKKYMADN